MNWTDAVALNAAIAERANSRRNILRGLSADLLAEAKDLVTVDPELAVEIINFSQELMRLASRIPVYKEKKNDED